MPGTPSAAWVAGASRKEIATEFLQACKAYRIDECMGEYKPFQ